MFTLLRQLLKVSTILPTHTHAYRRARHSLIALSMMLSSVSHQMCSRRCFSSSNVIFMHRQLIRPAGGRRPISRGRPDWGRGCSVATDAIVWKWLSPAGDVVRCRVSV